ncbi:MAG: hypothetical protein RLZZ123_241 [Pseudomonadota bacterium]
MNALTDALLKEIPGAVRIQSGDVSNYSPSDIRQSISELVAQAKMPLADALAEAGLSLYPQSEEILAIAALLSEVRQDWATAVSLLRQLVEVQGEASSPATTWLHLVRVLRCMCEPAQALEAVEKALRHHPEHEVLQKEKTDLLAQFNSFSDVHTARDAA